MLFFSLVSLHYCTIDLVMVERVLEMYVIYLWLMYFYQISYIENCDDVDEMMGAEWVCHKDAWPLLWQLAESCVEHNQHETIFTDGGFMCKYTKRSYGSCS